MAKESDPKDLFDFELPDGLANDVGGDWESAFQAEDFMLSPEDEAEVLQGKENGTAEEAKLEDVASLLISDEPEAKVGVPPSPDAAISESTPPVGAARRIHPPGSLLPPALAVLLARGGSWLQTRPAYQKILIPGLALGAILVASAMLFFHATNRELAEKPPAAIPPSVAAKAPQPQTDTRPAPQPNHLEPASAPSVQTAMQSEQAPAAPAKSRKKWRLPAFLIAVPQANGQGNLLVNIDLTLVLQLEPGSTIPEEKKPAVRDTIFQFFVNRSADELRRYALARGEMISGLSSWLRKECPQNPVDAIMFDRYQVLN